MKLLTGILLTITLLTTASAAAGDLDFIYEHYSTENGLPHNSIADIHQDRTGYIWICTWYGLSRFDGNTFVNYTTHPGDYANLSHNRMLSIAEDCNSYLWLTTYDYRLFRFDKAEEKFVAIPEDLSMPEIRDHKVRLFINDSRGNAWVSLQGYGLCRISPDLEVHSYASDPNIGKDVSLLFEASDGTVYSVSEEGTAAVRGDTSTLISRNHDVTSVKEFGSRIYFASPGTLAALDRRSGTQSRIDLRPLGCGELSTMQTSGGSGCTRLYLGFTGSAIAEVDTTDLSLNVRRSGMGRVRYLYPDSGGLLWIASDKVGIWSWNPERQRFRHYEHPRNVVSYYTDSLARVVQRGDRTWVKMNGYGFGWYDRENDSIVPLDNLQGQRFMNGVACFDPDSSGVLWFSTVKRGLERVTIIEPKVEVCAPPTRSSDPASASEYRGMLRDSQDRIWTANKSGEVFIYSPDMSSVTRLGGSESCGLVYNIFEDDRGQIWLGSKGSGLTRVRLHADGSTEMKHFRHNPGDPSSISSDNVYCTTQDLEGRIWVGTFGGGLSMLETPESEAFRTVYSDFPAYPLETGERVRYLHCMPDGRMLVAGVGGLIWFYPQSSTELIEFHSERKIPGDHESLGNNDIIHIFSDSSDAVWLCTFGGGINRLHFEDGRARFEIISTEEGLSSNIVQSAVCDVNGDIWLATETGISRISSGADGNRRVANYNKYDGMLSTTFSEASCVRLADGRIAFGTLDNIHVLRPEDFNFSSEPKRLVISGLQIDSRRSSVEGAEKVVIPHGYSYFRIDFAALNFRIQGNVRYEYRLEGYDGDWISSENGASVTYSRIPHGRYEFKVRAYGSGETSAGGETVVLPMRIKPSPWESTPAVILYILIIVAVAAILEKMFVTSVRLRNDMKVEQEVNDMKVRFFTNVSHELRTPLTLILGGLEELRKDLQEDGRKAYSANIAYRNARRMMTLVDQLLDTRKMVSGKMRLSVSQFDIVRLVRGVSDDFSDLAAERRMELSLTLPADALMVWGDASRIEALIYNLLSNAFKYTPDGGRICVSVVHHNGDSSYTISVRDNGMGVPRDKQESIFEPFVQGSASAYRGMSGSGIGLSFCKEIVSMHSGHIWVESRGSGEGSCFCVSLPMGREHFPESLADFVDSSDSIVASADTVDVGLSRFKVDRKHPAGALKLLVVEDNAELRVFLYNALGSLYEVHDAPDGEEALKMIHGGFTPDMIITDLMMPGVNGIELINKIRADFATSHIPIILITAKSEDESHLQAMKFGADAYITKPFTMELLRAGIENLLQRRRTLLSAFSSQGADGKVSISPKEVAITDKDKELIDKVAAWLKDNAGNAEATVDSLTTYLGMGRTRMYNKLKGLTGKSPQELMADYRLDMADSYLRSGQYSVSETAYLTGFSDPAYFSRSFKKRFGVTPAARIKENNKPNNNRNA